MNGLTDGQVVHADDVIEVSKVVPSQSDALLRRVFVERTDALNAARHALRQVSLDPRFGLLDEPTQRAVLAFTQSPGGRS